MSIYFNRETMQFYLHTKHTSYVMELYANHLAHSYWGSRVNEIPNLEAYYPFWFGADFSATNIPGRMLNSTDKLPQEYPTYGTGDMRSPALQIENAAGDSITCLCYEGHRIFSGKPQLSGLPATYGDDCETLEITLTDKLTGITAVLTYTVFPEKDVLTRSVRIENRGKNAGGVWEDVYVKGSGATQKTKAMPSGSTIRKIAENAYLCQDEPWVTRRTPKPIEDAHPRYHYVYGFGDKGLDISVQYGVTIAYSDIRDLDAGFHLRYLYTGNDVDLP